MSASPLSMGQLELASGKNAVWKVVVWKADVQDGCVCVCVCTSACVSTMLCHLAVAEKGTSPSVLSGAHFLVSSSPAQLTKSGTRRFSDLRSLANLSAALASQ